MNIQQRRVAVLDTRKSHFLWDVGLSGYLLGAPILAEDTVGVLRISAEGMAHFVACDLWDGKVRFALNLVSTVERPEDVVRLVGPDAFGTITEKEVQCRTLRSGNELWTFRPAWGPPRRLLVVQDRLFILSGQNVFSAHDAVSGVLLWKRELPEGVDWGSLSLAGEKGLYAAGQGGQVVAMNYGTGQIAWTYDPPRATKMSQRPPLDGGDVLLLFESGSDEKPAAPPQAATKVTFLSTRNGKAIEERELPGDFRYRGRVRTMAVVVTSEGAFGFELGSVPDIQFQ
jgi:outer membrane protein assembly factor BamB